GGAVRGSEPDFALPPVIGFDNVTARESDPATVGRNGGAVSALDAGKILQFQRPLRNLGGLFGGGKKCCCGELIQKEDSNTGLVAKQWYVSEHRRLLEFGLKSRMISMKNGHNLQQLCEPLYGCGVKLAVGRPRGSSLPKFFEICVFGFRSRSDSLSLGRS